MPGESSPHQAVVISLQIFEYLFCIEDTFYFVNLVVLKKKTPTFGFSFVVVLVFWGFFVGFFFESSHSREVA